MMNYPEIKGNVKKLYKIREEKKKLQEEEQEIIKQISNYSFCSGEKRMDILLDDDEELCINPIYVRVNVSKRKTVDFDLGKLKKKFSKEIYNAVVKKTYQVVDMEGLVQYLKSCGVNPKKFKEHIQRTEVLDKEKMYKLYDLGDISLDDLKGCYSIKESNPYITITENGGQKG